MPDKERMKISRLEIDDRWLDIYWGGPGPSVRIDLLEFPALRGVGKVYKYSMPLTSIKEFCIEPLEGNKIELLARHGNVATSLGVTNKDNQMAYRWIEVANAALDRIRKHPPEVKPRISHFSIGTGDEPLLIHWCMDRKKPGVVLDRERHELAGFDFTKLEKYKVPVRELAEFHTVPSEEGKVIELQAKWRDGRVECLGLAEAGDEMAYQWIELANAELTKAG